MRKFVLAAAMPGALLAAALSLSLSANPVEHCVVEAPEKRSSAELEAELERVGWDVQTQRTHVGCYEVYATDGEGRHIEAMFDPATFELLYAAQRGKVLFRK